MDKAVAAEGVAGVAAVDADRAAGAAATADPSKPQQEIRRAALFAWPVLFIRIIEPMKARAALAFTAVGILWGSAWVPNSTLLRAMPSLRAGALRFAVAAAFATVLTLIARRRPGTTSVISGSACSTALILGTTALALPYALTAWAAGQASSGTVAILFAFTPLAALLLNKEVVSAAIPVLVIGIGGVACLVAAGVSLSAAQIKGVMLLVCGVVSSAFSLNYARTHLRRSDLLVSVTIQFAFAAVLLGAVSAATELGQPAVWNQETILSLLILGIVVSGSSLPIMYGLLVELQPWQVAALQWSATLVAVAESAWFLRAKPAAEMWIGASLVTGATVWLLRGSGARPGVVTLQLTNYTGEASDASESEVGSK